MTTDNESGFLSPEIEEILEKEAEKKAVLIVDELKEKAKASWITKKEKFATSSEMRESIESNPLYEAFFCSGYVSGVLDSGNV